MLKCQFLIEKSLQIKQNIYLLKMSWKKLKRVDLGYFIAKSLFDEDIAQHYLVFQSILMKFVKFLLKLTIL